MTDKLTALVVVGMPGAPLVVEGAPYDVARALNAAGPTLVSFKLDAPDVSQVGARVYVNPAHVVVVCDATRQDAPTAPRIHLA